MLNDAYIGERYETIKTIKTGVSGFSFPRRKEIKRTSHDRTSKNSRS